MPLSEEELRQLEQMERALAEEDPKFASTLRGTTMRRTGRRRVILAAVAFVCGVALLLAGVIVQISPLGIAGFVIMLLAATFGLTALRGQRVLSDVEPETSTKGGFQVIQGGKKSKSRSRSGSKDFMDRMDERWRRRRNNGY